MTCALARIWADSKAQGKCFTNKRYRSSACLHLTSLDTLLSSAATWFNIPKDSNSLIPFPMSCWRKFRRTFRCQDWGVSSHICTNLLWPNGTNKGQPTSTGLPEHRTSIWSRKVGESLDWRFLRSLKTAFRWRKRPRDPASTGWGHEAGWDRPMSFYDTKRIQKASLQVVL